MEIYRQLFGFSGAAAKHRYDERCNVDDGDDK
jgi:hypothetical protein